MEKHIPFRLMILFSLFALVVGVINSCSDDIPFRRRIIQESVKEKGIEPLVLSVSIDSIILPTATVSLYKLSFEKKRNELRTFYKGMIQSYQGMSESYDGMYKRTLSYDRVRAERYKRDKLAHDSTVLHYQAELRDIESGTHPGLDSLQKRIQNPREWQVTTVRYKISESAPINVEQLIFEVGRDTLLVKKENL